MIRKGLSKIASKLAEIFEVALIVAITVFSFYSVAPVQAATGVPEMISYQGRLLDSSGNLLGGSGTDYCFKFSIHDASAGGSQLWPAGTPSTMTVNVKNGVYNVNIGDVAAGGDALTYNFNDNDTVYLGVQVATKVGATCAPGDGAEVFEALSPRQQIVSSGYAINADTIDGFHASQTPVANEIPVLDGAGALTLTGEMITDGALTAVGNFSTPHGADYPTTGVQNNVNLGTGAMFRYTGAGTATFTGLAGGTDGRIIRIHNASGFILTLANANAGSLASNRINTGSGADVPINPDVTASLQYDSQAGHWHILSLPVTALANTIFNQGGDSFGTTATLGTNDANALSFETGGTTRFTIPNGSPSTLIGTGATVLSSGAGSALTVNSGSNSTSGALILASGNAAAGTAGNVTIDVGTSSSGNGSILIGNAARSQTITIGNSTGGTITVGASSGSDLALNDAQWSITGAGLIATSNNVIVNGGSVTSSTGALRVDGAAALNLGTTSATSVGLGASGITTTNNGALTVSQALTANGLSTFNTDADFTLSGTENIAATSDLAGTVNVISLIATPSSTAGTTSGLFIQQANSANTNGLDSAVAIDNADTNLAVPSAISITNSGGGGYTKLLDTPSLDISGAGAISGATGFVSTGGAGSLTLNNAAFFSCGKLNTDGAGNILCGTDATGGGSGTLQDAYDAGTPGSKGNIATTGDDFNFTLNSGDNFNIIQGTGSNSVNITPGAASQFTSGGALTFTAGAASTWGTTAGDLTLQVAGAGTGSVKIGTGGAGTTTPDILALDVKSTTGDPAGFNGAMYYNAADNVFRCFTNGSWGNCDTTGGTTTLQTAYAADNNLSVTSGEGPLTVTGTSANVDFLIGNGTDTGDFRIWDGTDNWLLVDESADTLAIGAAAGSGITIGGTGILTTNAGALTVAETLSANGDTAIGNATTDRLTVNSQISGASPLVFQGTTDNAFTTTFAITDPSGSSKTITFPNASGTVAFVADTISPSLVDNTANALDIQEGTNNYINVNTTNSAENIAFGNATTNPTYSFLGSGLTSFSDGVSVAGALTPSGNFATPAGADYTTTGSQNDVTFGTGTLFRYTGAGDATITGITGGTDGRWMRIMNVSGFNIFFTNNDPASTAGNRIITATGGNLTIPTDVTVTFQYDSTFNAGEGAWRTVVLPAVRGTLETVAFLNGGNSFGGAATLGTNDGNSLSFETSGSTRLTLAAGSSTLTGTGATSLLSPTTSALTLDSGTTGTVNLGTGNNGKTVNIATGTAGDVINIATDNTTPDTINIGSATDTLTLTGNSSSTFVLNGATVTATEFNRLDGHDAALIDTNDAVNTAITGTGALNSGSITSGFGSIDTGADNITTTGVVQGTASVLTSALDTVAAGALTIGNSTATSTSICNSAACDTILIGTNADADTITIGDTSDTFSLASTGLNVSTAGALTGVASLDTISTSATGLTFAGTGTVSSGAGTAMTVDSGTTGTVNLGTGNNAKAINIGTGTAGDTIHIGTDNTTADTIVIGSALDSLTIASSAFNVSSAGAISGVTSIGASGAISTSGNISTTGTGTITSAGLLTASNGLTMTTGALNLTATSGALTLSGLSASSINTGANALTITSSNFNTTSTGINSTAIGATTASTGKFTTLTSTGATDLANAGASNVTVATTGTGNVTIGNSTGTFALTSNGGLNVTTAGALTGVASLDTISTSATGLTFAGTGTISSTTSSALTLDSGTTGNVNLGTGANAKTVTIGNATGASTTNLLAGSGNVTVGTSDTTGTQLVLDTKTGSGDPTGVNGGMYYNSNTNKFRCFENSAWADCITGGLNNIKTTNTAPSPVTTITVAIASYSSVTITPSATTKDIWLTTDVALNNNSNNSTVTLSIWRGATCASPSVQVGTNVSQQVIKNAVSSAEIVANFIDSPAASTATTYQLCLSATTVITSPAGGISSTQITAAEVKLGADLAEAYHSTEGAIEPGMVVVSDSTIAGGVKRSGKRYDSSVLGVISTNPGMVLSDRAGAGTPVLLALSGRIPVNVTDENGPIKAGDYLTSSSTPGVAMKATKAGTVVGQALTDWSVDGEGKVMAFIKNTYYNGESDEVFNSTDALGTLAARATQAAATSSNTTAPASTSNISADRIAAGLEIITPSVVAENISTDKIMNSHGELAVSFDDSGNAAFVGTLTAKKVSIMELDAPIIVTLTDGLTALTARVATLENTVSANSSAITDLQSKIDSLTSTINAMQLAKSDSKISLDGLTLSNLAVNGLAVSGAATFSDDVDFIGTPYLNADTAGFAKVKTGGSKVEIKFTKEYLNQPIVNATMTMEDQADPANNLTDDQISSLLAKGYTFVVAHKSNNGFTIILNKPAEEDLIFSWTAFAVKNPTITESIAQVEAPMQTPVIAPTSTTTTTDTTSAETTPTVTAPTTDASATTTTDAASADTTSTAANDPTSVTAAPADTTPASTDTTTAATDAASTDAVVADPIVPATVATDSATATTTGTVAPDATSDTSVTPAP